LLNGYSIVFVRVDGAREFQKKAVPQSIARGSDNYGHSGNIAQGYCRDVQNSRSMQPSEERKRAKQADELSPVEKEMLPGKKQDGDTTVNPDITVHSTDGFGLSTGSALSFVGMILNGHFEILSLIGEGGMSYVYKAKDIVLNKIVAVKLLRPSLLHQSNIVRRLQTEALATSSLEHRNTVGVRHFDVTKEGLPYLVMVYLEGKSIAEIIANEGPFESDRAIKILHQIADALAHAHKKGIIHRDLKSNNVLLINQDGDPDFVKVVDFGIAKIVNPDGVDVRSQLTITGEIFGSPIAMSPEQCRGGDIDVRSDVYAFGCLMYQILTGKPVYDTKNNFELLFKQLNEMPDSFKVACLQKKIRPQLEAITFKAIQKVPRDRYQSMDELIEDLNALNVDSPFSTIAARLKLSGQKIRRKKKSVALVVVCGLLALGMAGYVAMQQFGTPREMLLTQVLPWQYPALAPLPKDSEKPIAVDGRKLILEVKQYKKNIESRMELWKFVLLPTSKQTHPPESIEQDTRGALVRLADYANRLYSIGAYTELMEVGKCDCYVASVYTKTILRGDKQQDVASAAGAVKQTGDVMQKAGLFPPAELVYLAAAIISRHYSGFGSADDQYFGKLASDSRFATAEYGSRNQEEYQRARPGYDAFLLATKNDPHLVDRADYGFVGDQKVTGPPDLLAESPLAWDARRKRAEIEYVSKEYVNAVSDYQWIFTHPLPKSVVPPDKQALLYCHFADSERMTLPLMEAGADRTAVDAVKNYYSGLDEGDPKNIALAHAYMLALVERYNLSAAPLPAGLTEKTAVAEVRKQFGENNPVTLLVERQFADNLWKQGKWLDALK
jgi:serine/threonine protein kinase